MEKNKLSCLFVCFGFLPPRRALCPCLSYRILNVQVLVPVPKEAVRATPSHCCREEGKAHLKKSMLKANTKPGRECSKNTDHYRPNLFFLDVQSQHFQCKSLNKRPRITGGKTCIVPLCQRPHLLSNNY